MQYIKILCYFCGLSIDDEYSLYHDFSNAITARDIKLVENIIDFVEQRNNPFKKDNRNVIKKGDNRKSRCIGENVSGCY